MDAEKPYPNIHVLETEYEWAETSLNNRKVFGVSYYRNKVRQLNVQNESNNNIIPFNCKRSCHLTGFDILN